MIRERASAAWWHLKHFFTAPPDITQDPYGRTTLLQRGPQYSQWLWEQLQNKGSSPLPAVLRASEVLVSSLLSLPMQVGRLRDTDDPYPNYEVVDHPLNQLFAMPSRACTTHDLWSDFFTRYIRDSNAYLFVRRTMDGLPIELVPVHCRRSESKGNALSTQGIRIEHLLDPLIGDAFPKPRNQDGTWRDMHVVRVHRQSTWQPKAMRSLPPLTGYALGVVNNNHLLQQHYLRSLSRPLSGSGVIEMDASIMDRNHGKDYKDYFEIASQFGDEAAEWLKKDKILTLPPGMSVASAVAPLDLKALDLVDLTVDEVARIYGVPPSFLYRTYAGGGQPPRAYEQENTAFARRSVRDHADNIAAALTAKLLFPEERAQGLMVMLPIDSLELGTMTERIEAATMAVADGGLLDRDEGRGMIGRDAVGDGAGRTFFEPRGGPRSRTPQEGMQPQQQVEPLRTPQNGHDNALSRTSV